MKKSIATRNVSKKSIATFLVAIMISNVAIADCDFNTGITKQGESFLYTRECHIKVGQIKQDLETVHTQIADYKKAIDLKDLALAKTNDRADLWMNTSFKLQDRMNAIDDLKSKNQWLMFFGGVVFTSLAVWGAGQLR